MEWLERLMNDDICPECGQVRSMWSNTQRKIQEDFSAMCLEVGKPQQDVLEEILTYAIEQYNEGRG